LMVRAGAEWQRVGHLFPLALLGGDRAAREPWRMGVAALISLGRGAEAARRFPDIALAGRLAEVFAAGSNVPTTSSMGRLFDAAAALLGVRQEQSYEGQAAMELEALIRAPRGLPDGYRLTDHVLDFRPLLASLLEPGVGKRDGAELFHGTLIAGLAEWISDAAREGGHRHIVLGGGCLMNRTLSEGLAGALRLRGLSPWLPHAVPANDGGLSLGQAALGRARLMGDGAPQRSSGR